MGTQSELIEEILRCIDCLNLSWQETKDMFSFDAADVLIEQVELLLNQLKTKVTELKP